jgi:hypothetical protein
MEQLGREGRTRLRHGADHQTHRIFVVKPERRREVDERIILK